jgi:hypothetical protein
MGVESEALRHVLADPEAPAAAKVQAARTLLELDGQLGRLQVEPPAKRSDLSTMTRAELLAEVERLRTPGDSGQGTDTG